MDLTKAYPRSPYEKLGGYMMLGRTSDKARAKHKNTLGEYIYNCPLDQVLFEFLGVNADAFLVAVKPETTDAEALAWVKANQTPRGAADIETFNRWISQLGPEDEESRAYFENARRRVAPNRSDLRSWFDLIEAEEGRL
jgi:hypothetical protein